MPVQNWNFINRRSASIGTIARVSHEVYADLPVDTIVVLLAGVFTEICK
jgi:hypothetical protein